MAIELFILSGSHQGETRRFTRSSISIGESKDCDVSFAAKQNPGAAGKKARLLNDEYGWQIRNVGEGDFYVNQDLVANEGAAPLRSGDIVRLSELGPDVRFAIIADSRPTAAKAKPIPDSTAVEMPAEPTLAEANPPAKSIRRPQRSSGGLIPVVIIATCVAVLVLTLLIMKNYFSERPKASSQRDHIRGTMTVVQSLPATGDVR